MKTLCNEKPLHETHLVSEGAMRFGGDAAGYVERARKPQVCNLYVCRVSGKITVSEGAVCLGGDAAGNAECTRKPQVCHLLSRVRQFDGLVGVSG